MESRSRRTRWARIRLLTSFGALANAFPAEGHAARDEALDLKHTSHGDLRARCGGSAASPIRVLLSEGITPCK
jgi:hypothetical protein